MEVANHHACRKGGIIEIGSIPIAVRRKGMVAYGYVVDVVVSPFQEITDILVCFEYFTEMCAEVYGEVLS